VTQINSSLCLSQARFILKMEIAMASSQQFNPRAENGSKILFMAVRHPRLWE